MSVVEIIKALVRPILTLGIVTAYFGALGYGLLFADTVTVSEFTAAAGGPALMVLSFWFGERKGGKAKP